VRAHGVVSEVPGAGTTDHVCWVYDDDAEFDRAVEAFLAGGLERGERLLCVGERAIASLTGLPRDVAPLLASGAVQTQTLAQAYEAAGPFVPESQLAYYEAATQRALDDGYRGLRVIAEISILAADPATRSELMRWEHVADDFIAQAAGFTAMCAYTGELPLEALADVASVHPLVHTPEGLPPFRAFFEDDHLVLAGSLDSCGAERLSQVLASSPIGRRGPVLDVRRVEFVDVAASRAVARWAQDLAVRGATLEIRGASPLLRRMWRILALDVLAPVTFTATAA
jgi:MEDS: MEthanogen/methylotroph, DcmR Sensory domain/STAS domain